ncbi:MAG TPA: M48 family metalloprotease [Gaiellaceae bacterium]|jgi:STE24 endopeptidase|nr:M48 family metalloprotease [Gaiellaceae bacterium]
MSEMTAMRIGRAATLAVGAVVWCVAAWLLWRTSVPSLHLSGFDEHRYFSPHALARSRSYSRGEEVLWLLATAATLIALIVLALRLPRSIREIGLGRIGSAIVAGMVLLVTLWFVSLPFSLADLWWQHHWGLGPLDIAAWLAAQWSTLGPEAVSAMATIVLLVGLAGRYRRWWLIAWPVIVAIAVLFAFVSGWLGTATAHPLRDAQLRSDVARIEGVEHVSGTPVGVQDVSSWTNQANAFTVGFGPATHVVVWNTLLDGRFSRGEVDVVLAHELGHVRSRHILKALGWTALLVLPTLWLAAFVTRRRGGVGDPANLPLVILTLTVLALLTAPVQNVVSRRYEAEADWRALNATRDPASARALFESFEQTSLEEPSPPLWDYLWLENHPTLMQRIAMTERWR